MLKCKEDKPHTNELASSLIYNLTFQLLFLILLFQTFKGESHVYSIYLNLYLSDLTLWSTEFILL